MVDNVEIKKLEVEYCKEGYFIVTPKFMFMSEEHVEAVKILIKNAIIAGESIDQINDVTKSFERIIRTK